MDPSGNLDYLDTQEQEEIIASLERSNAVQNRVWRGVFSLLGAGLALFFLRSAALQARAPWERQYHAHFAGVLSQGTTVVADVSTAGAILCGGLVLHAGSRAVLHRALVAATLLLSLATAAFWLGALRTVGSWRNFWLTMSPLFGILCLYVDHSLQSTTLQINRLRASKYRFKKA
ncbi:hypothetical protein KFL_000930010 [Klebsormidium nitens]|uniref:Uncharacterized protein n=1 Tax=Klebsormidium nitens TaxID=105231 RepID=A0A1Y1HTA2_KLENI|nr:hypothetical protein KFL_000930010 [Klebsormidium nitens]|eukprot:GAQ81855.1 hypothetical protein KFL_000930010 [Klebsormidium nitens]